MMSDSSRPEPDGQQPHGSSCRLTTELVSVSVRRRLDHLKPLIRWGLPRHLRLLQSRNRSVTGLVRRCGRCQPASNCSQVSVKRQVSRLIQTDASCATLSRPGKIDKKWMDFATNQK